MAEILEKRSGFAIAGIVLGTFLMLPGICGAYAFGLLFFDHVKRASVKFDAYAELVWLVAHASILIGVVGIYIIARVKTKHPLPKISLYLGWVAWALSALTALVFVINGARLNGTLFSEYSAFALWALALGFAATWYIWVPLLRKFRSTGKAGQKAENDHE